MDYVLSFDVGTSTLKAILVSKDGKVRECAHGSYEVYFPRDGWVEMDPADWWEAIVRVTKKIMTGCDVPPEEVKGIVFCTQSMNVIPISSEGIVPRPGLSWLDSRADEEAAEITAMIGGEEVCRSLMGTVFSGMDSLPKVRWLMKHEPEMFADMKCFLDCNGYLTYRATGELVCDIASASMLGYDRESGSVIRDLIATTGFDPDNFPRLVKSYEKVGNLTETAAKQLGLTTETLVFGGTNDMQGAAIGTGRPGVDEAHVYLGTSGWAAVGSDQVASLSNGGGCIMSANPELQLWVYSTETCCATFDWFIDNFFVAEKNSPLIPNVFVHTDQLAAEIPPGSDNVIFNPWLSGERSPIQDVFVRGGFLNIGMSHTRAHLLRAVMESVAYNLRWCYDSLEADLGKQLGAVRILGGGTQSKVWMQIFADVFNRQIEVVEDTQIAGAIGGAFLAALGLGLYTDFEESKEWARISHVYEPCAENAAIYEEGFQVFKKSYEVVKDFYQELNKR